MEPSTSLALFACGAFVLTGMLTGVWKYIWVSRSPRSEAPRYVSVAHHASLLYSFASLVMVELLKFSAYSETVKLIATAVPLFFFAAATSTYVIHGILSDTDNQFRSPYRMGSLHFAPAAFHLGVWVLILGEIGGFGVLFVGFLQTALAGR